MKTILLAAAAVLTAALLVGLFVDFEAAAALLAMGALGMGFAVKDASLKKSHALPNGAATTQGAGIDLGHGGYGDFVADCELLIEAPALTVGEAANGDTITYSIEHDTDQAFGTVATVLASVLVQTGAGGVGAAAATVQVRLPVDVKRYIRLKTVKTGTGNATTKNATLNVVT